MPVSTATPIYCLSCLILSLRDVRQCKFMQMCQTGVVDAPGEIELIGQSELDW